MKIPGIKARELASELGIGVQTVYNWKTLPGYVERYLKLKKRCHDLEQDNAALRTLLKETSAWSYSPTCSTQDKNR